MSMHLRLRSSTIRCKRNGRHCSHSSGALRNREMSALGKPPGEQNGGNTTAYFPPGSTRQHNITSTPTVCNYQKEPTKSPKLYKCALGSGHMLSGQGLQVSYNGLVPSTERYCTTDSFQRLRLHFAGSSTACLAYDHLLVLGLWDLELNYPQVVTSPRE